MQVADDESWKNLARKRRALKVSKDKKLKSGGCVDGEKGKSSLGKYKRGGGVPDTEDEKEIKKLGKDQDSQETAWDKMKSGGRIKRDDGGSIPGERGSVQSIKAQQAAKQAAASGSIPGERGSTLSLRAQQAAQPTNDDDDTIELKSGGWIKSAIKHPGAEKKAAAKAGKSTHEYMEEHKHDSGKAGSRARLGLTLSKMSKK